ncbi:hypothetical protein FDC27_12780 [Clostridium botulinum]|nr:hypothetical protein [Clostridium botulinum]NFL59902.1 hypothetical protein [Clostridium botulinum]NFL63301.1 hypothetical protein [Clostridium botulinum]NFO67803.1 hypothetical protein [Clostridium botulinum]
MEKLRLLVTMVSSFGEKGRKARKIVMAISSIKFLLNNDIDCGDMKWNYIVKSKEEFKVAIKELYERLNIDLFNSYDVINFIDRLNDNEFEKVITSFNYFNDNIDALELIYTYRNMSNMERDSGQYITNDNVLQIGLKFIQIPERTTVIDSFNGESGVLVNICSQFKKENKDFSTIKFFAQEKDKESKETGELIAYLLGNKEFQIELGDSIEEPAFVKDNKLIEFDFAISVPPFALKGETDYIDKYTRFRAFKGRKINYNNASWLLAEHIISTVKENGKAAILMPIGSLFRSSINDITVKKGLVNEDLIECIIKIPAGILNYTGIQTCWIIINKNKSIKRKDKIQFIDLSEKVENVGRREKIVPEEYIDVALTQFNEMKESDISFIVDRKVIEENEYNLDMFEYMKQKELLKNVDIDSALKLSDIASIRRGVQATKSKLDVLNKEKDKSHFLIGLGNIVDGKIMLNEEEKIAAEDRWIDLYQVKEGDILLTSKGSVLKIAIVDSSIKNAILSSNLFFIRVNQNKYKPEILKYYLESESGQKLLSTIMKGAVIKSISNKDLEGLVIPKINIDEQNDISNMIIKARTELEDSVKKAEEKFKQKQNEIAKRMSV